MAGTNKVVLCSCLLMLMALSSGSARELSPLLEGDVDPGDTKSQWKCFRLWDNYCVKNKRCVDECLGVEGKGYTHGHCELWTCVCCKKNGEDEILAPGGQLGGPEQRAESPISVKQTKR
ncbi:uncharacterized protein [Zea mays]|uniref:uncharacterized protein n=1 Tax=Zea mays TaxID=4577 RepID=UPI0002219FCC|nr:uncharacterized protein LOC103647743 [Zea mays]|eukprot:XP_008670479.1 uncharacterized protein LOC103647743 [Zea mays]